MTHDATPSPGTLPKSPDLAPGTVLQDRYLIGRELGRGSFAIAYLATDQQTGQTCVVKKLALSAAGTWKTVELFEREGEVLARLNHARLPKHQAFFTVDNPGSLDYYLVQDYVRGQNLAQVLASGKRLMAYDVLRIALDLADILAYLHRFSPPIIHRDIKPSNIILGPNLRAYLIDFSGVRDAAAQDADEAGGASTVVGTYGYMPYEQFSGKAYPASDIYALGATLIHLLTRQAPSTLHDADMRLDFKDQAMVSDPFLAVLQRMVEPDWQDRYQNGAELKEALAAIRQRRPASRLRSGVLAALSASALLAVGVAYWQHTRPATNLPATAAGTGAAAIFDENLLVSGFRKEDGWVLPRNVTAYGTQLRLAANEVAFHDIDLKPYRPPGMQEPLAMTIAARVVDNREAVATISAWSEPDGRLLAETSTRAEHPYDPLRTTFDLPSAEAVRVVFYSHAAASNPRWVVRATFADPEVMIHRRRAPADSPPKAPSPPVLSLTDPVPVSSRPSPNPPASARPSPPAATRPPVRPRVKPTNRPVSAPNGRPSISAGMPPGREDTAWAPRVEVNHQPVPMVSSAPLRSPLAGDRQLPGSFPRYLRHPQRPVEPRRPAFTPWPSKPPVLAFPTPWTYRTQVFIPRAPSNGQ